MDNKLFWYNEWHYAVKNSKTEYANICKQNYRDIVIDELRKEPSMWYVDKLKSMPTIYLN